MLTENKIILLAFATDDLQNSINRLTKQANDSNFYEKIKIECLEKSFYMFDLSQVHQYQII